MSTLLILHQHQPPPRHKQFACVAQLVQQSPCKRSLVGSTPITGSNSSRVKPWGRRPVLETGSGTFESFTRDQLLHGSSVVELTAVNRDVAGSIPARAELWPSSSSLRHKVVDLATRVRISLATPACLRQSVERDGLNPFKSEFESQDKHHAHISQLVEEVASKAICCKFESCCEHHASVVQLAETTVLEAVRCKFESCQGHHMRESVNGKPTASKAVTGRSSRSSRAMLISSSGPGHPPVTGKIAGSNPAMSANGVEPIGRTLFAKQLERNCSVGSNPTYSVYGDDPNWKGACLENRCAERLAGSSPCHPRHVCHCGDCGQHMPLKAVGSQFDSDRWHHASVGEWLKPRSCNLRSERTSLVRI